MRQRELVEQPQKWPQPCILCFSSQGTKALCKCSASPLDVRAYTTHLLEEKCPPSTRAWAAQSHTAAGIAEGLPESLANKGHAPKGHLAMSLFSTSCWDTSSPIWQQAGKAHPSNQIIFTEKHCNKNIIHWIHPGWRGPVGSCILGKVDVYNCTGDHKCS